MVNERTFTYDSANRLTLVVGGGVTTQFTYNGDGDRLAQIVTSVTTKYALDPTGLAQVLIETTSGQSTHYLPGLAQYGSNAWSYYLPDRLGSVRQLTDHSGAVTLARSYDPFGNGLEQVGAGQSTFGYTGEQMDPTGLVFLRARYYNPGSGRFLTADSIIPDPLRSGGWNRYAYVGNNPINQVDPSGQTVKPPFIFCLYGVDPETGKCKDPFSGLGGLGAVMSTPASDPYSAIGKTARYILGAGICFFAGEAVFTENWSNTKTIPETQTQSESKPSPTVAPPQPVPTPTQDYLVRVQVQGRSLSVGAAGDSIVLRNTSPIRASATIVALDTLQARLKRSDLSLTSQAFARAKVWVSRVAAAGGTGPIGSKSFNNQGVSGRDARVDIEILRGERNLVP